MDINRFARVPLAHLPTPLEPLENLTRLLGGPEIWIKRDDCTGLSTGGNKARKLEFLMAEAVAAGAEIVLTHGATQSNHARQTAAAAAKLGLSCHLLLEDRTGRGDDDYRANGNILLDLLHGAIVEHCLPNSDMNGALEVVAQRLQRAGEKPYVIPGGGSNSLGALGYVNAASELLRQADDIGLVIDHVVHATGSAGTQAGLLVGLEGMESRVGVIGIGVRANRETQEANVFRLATATANKLELKQRVTRDRVIANCNYIGPGYGHPTRETIEAINILARLEGILLDPVYSGKGMAGLIDLIRKGYFRKNERVVFLHTGGAASLFSYRDDLLNHD